ncbi:MAG: siroheme synthase CysG [Marinicellaceae bacterium]
MDYLPINIKLKHKKCLVLGGGAVAFRKIQMLLKAEAHVICVAKIIHKDIRKIAKNITTINKDIYDYLQHTHLNNITLILSATSNDKLSLHIFKLAQLNNILVNTVDKKELCTYISPAIVNRNPIIVSISSSGSAPVLARKIREKIEKILPHNLAVLAKFSDSLRETIKHILPSMQLRKKFWEKLFNSPISFRIMNTGLKPKVHDLVNSFSAAKNNDGEVFLVGAGPGDPELLTIKALRVMQEADVVFHDRLISPEILELVRRDAELINVGKSMGNHFVEQKDTNQLLVEHARQGKRVCRLKGGDPFVFGRGGEEIQALRAAHVNYQIIPGITAAIGCTSYAGIPLTHRDYAQKVVFLTAHCKNSIDTLDWPSLAQGRQTLVVFMGLMKSLHLQNNLIDNGKTESTPVAIIENGTCNNQRVINGNLCELSQLIKSYSIQSPALIVIGEVAQLSKELAWFNSDNQKTNQEYFLKTA